LFTPANVTFIDTIYPVDWIQYDNQAKAQLVIWVGLGRGPAGLVRRNFVAGQRWAFEIEISKIIFAFS